MAKKSKTRTIDFVKMAGCGNDFIVIESIKELETLSKKKLKDPHKPYIDEIKIPCKRCNGIKKRIPDILDVWVDAGTTSWSCLDYPQKSGLFKKLWPADFILEGHITNLRRKSKFRSWILRNNAIELGIKAQLFDRKTGQKILMFKHKQQRREKNETHKVLGYRLGRALGAFIAENSL